LLAEAGWPLSDPRDREFKVVGMPTNDGIGYVDYVLWGLSSRRTATRPPPRPVRPIIMLSRCVPGAT
jgi:hypothetical protein